MSARWSPVSRTSQLDRAYDYIHNKLSRGELEPGRKLSRRRLAEEIGVSPALVQHALGQLEKAGLVECRAQSGTYVRELTEPYAASRAAERITPAQVRLLENSCRRYQGYEARISQAESDQEFWRIHSDIIDEERAFHGTILSAAGNHLLTSLIQSLRVLAHVPYDFARGSLLKTQELLKTQKSVSQEHLQIVQALKSRDGDLAQQTMRDHIRNGSDMLKQRLQERSARSPA
jgi:DNA-binding GntR family transcriptional regulator